MISTMRELRDLVAENCDFSQPLRIAAHDVGKKASRHSNIYVDENHPAKLTVEAGTVDDRGSVELSHDPEAGPIMPGEFVEALDAVLKGAPGELLSWFYFFYFPMDYTKRFGKPLHIEWSILDTNNIRDIYFYPGEVNTMIVEAEYNVGTFDAYKK